MKSERTLDRWALLMCGDKGPILAGRDPFGADYRTSTPIVAYDPESGTATTASGRPYRLVGPSDPRYALEALRALWNATGADVRVVSPDEAVPLVKRNRPHSETRSPEQQAEMDAYKLARVAGQFRFLILQRGLNVDDAACLLEIDENRLQAFVDGDVSEWTVEEADRAFDALAGVWNVECGRGM